MSCKSRIRSWPEKRKEAEPPAGPTRCKKGAQRALGPPRGPSPTPPKARKSALLVLQSHGITLSFHREMADSSRELVGLAFAHLLEKLGKGWPVFSCAFRHFD